MMPLTAKQIPKRPLAYTLALIALWVVFYASFTLFRPALLDDADSVHAEVAREMLLRHDYVTLYANGIRYLEKAPLLYWSMAAAMRVSQILGHASARCLAVAARIPLALSVLALAFAVEAFARRAFRSRRAGLYAGLVVLSCPGIFLFAHILLPDVMLCLWIALAIECFWGTEVGDFRLDPTHRDKAAMNGARICGGTFPRLCEMWGTRRSHLSEPRGGAGEDKYGDSGASLQNDEQRQMRGSLDSSRCSSLGMTASVAPPPTSLRDVGHPHLWRSILHLRSEMWGARVFCYGFAVCCALGVLTKGLIGVVFPVGMVAVYLLLTRGVRGAIHRVLRLHPFSAFAVFVVVAAPWHVLAAWANPTRGFPGGLTFALHPAQGLAHFSVPLPTDGNVHGWAWFYFVNEQVLRYLNLRVPHDYDTVPLWLFWGLCLVWLMPWSAFVFKAFGYLHAVFRSAYRAVEHGRWKHEGYIHQLRAMYFRPNAEALLIVWAAVPLLFFSFSTRQEYYVLPSLPPLAILIGGWLAQDAGGWQPVTEKAKRLRRTNLRCTAVMVALGAVFAAGAMFFLLQARRPAADADLAALLKQNPGDYALSMGHFLDLNAQALGLFRAPLGIAAASLFVGPLASYVLRRRARPHAAVLALAAGGFGFLLAVHMALQTFAPVLSSQRLAAAMAPQLGPDDVVVIHQEYEYGSTLGFYLERPGYEFADGEPVAVNPVHILTDAEYDGVREYGRSSNLWYGSFFPDAPAIFETRETLAAQWRGARRIFVWQDLADEPSALPAMPGPVYVVAQSGGKEVVSNRAGR